MKDLNYFPLDVVSNIYGMTTLEFDDRTSKVLVATMDCQIYCIDYNKFIPHTREVEFTYIPNGAKIISIGALKRGQNDYVIGITHSLAPNMQKGSSRSSSNLPGREINDYGRLTTYYFNIYASGSVSSNFDLDYVAQGCQTIRLRYVPYHLYQTEVISFVDSAHGKAIKRKPYWLLSAGDNSIHAFCEDLPYQSFNEVPIEVPFPELSKIPGLALWIDVMNIADGDSYERAIVLGFEDGSVRLYHSSLDATTNRYQLVKESSFDDYTTIVPSARLFKIKSTFSPKVLKTERTVSNDLRKSECRLNLLVASSTNPSLIFTDVLNSGLERSYELPESQRLDCVVTSVIGDTNFDGYNEILLGTHGKELMTYHYDSRTENYYLANVIKLNHPVFSISILDLTGDSMKEVIILLTSGVLVMQTAVRDVLEICKRRVDALLSTLT